MTEYHATEDDMRIYSEIVRRLAMLDIQRDQLLQSLQEWEQAHIVPEAAEPSDVPSE